MRMSHLPKSLVVILICCGCYSNRAIFDPWSYSPSSPSTSWKPTARAKVATSEVPELTVPEQEIPLSLAELIDVALRNNTQTWTTWAQARTSAAQYAQSQSSDFPVLEGFFYWERSKTPSFTTPVGPSFSTTAVGTTGGPAPPVTGGASQTVLQTGKSPPTPTLSTIFLSQWGPQFSLSYTVLDFGQKRATSEAARQALYFSDWTHNRAIQTVVQTITKDYYNYLYQKQLYEAYGEDIHTAQVTLESAELSLQSGVKDVSDYLQAKTKLLQVQTEWAAQQQEVEVSFATLLKDMGIPPNLKFTVQQLPEVNLADAQIKDADELLQIALQKRADLLAAEANLRSKKQAVAAAKLSYLPNVTYNALAGRTYFTGGLHDNNDWEMSISLNWPLFAGFFYRNQVRITRAQKEEAEADLRDKQLEVIKDITTAHHNIKVAHDTLQYANAFLQAAEEQYTVSLAKYKRGTNTILDVVSAQSSLADARAEQVNATQQWFTSLATLTYATGDLEVSLRKDEEEEDEQIVDNSEERDEN